MREVTFRIRHYGEPESDISASHPNVTIRSVTSLSGNAGKRKRIVDIQGPTAAIESFLTEFASADPIIDVNPFSPIDNERVFVGVTFDNHQWDSIAQQLADLGVHYRLGTTIQNGWEHWTVYLDEGDELSNIVNSLQKGGNTIELVRDVALSELRGDVHLVLSRVMADLTERQREVLAIAIDLGYYEDGAGIRIEDIAEEVGLAQTTTWEHLSRAEKKVMTEFGEYLSSRGQ